MALINKRITDREIAAIYLHVFGGVDDWKVLYAIADDGPGKAPETIDRSLVSRWKGTAKIQGLLEKVTREKILQLNEAEKAGAEKATAAEGSVRTENGVNLKNSKFVDYSSPAAQRAKLNELINTASDPGEALDALKVIIQGQRADREAAKEGRVNRVYLPLTCDSCPMYQKARKRAEKATEKGPEEL